MPRQREEKRKSIDWDTRQMVYVNYKGICAHCGKRIALHKDFTLDHFVPLSRGGRNEMRNYAALCYDCNQLKYDGVVDPAYFMKYAPAEMMAVLKEVYAEYLSTYDFLAHDCALIDDFFDLKVPIPVASMKSRRILNQNMTANIRKVHPEFAAEWLTLYAARLSYLDKALIITDESQLTTQYYMASINNKDILLFSPFFMDANIQTNVRPEGGERKVLSLELFASPEINNPENIYTGARVLTVILKLVEKLALDLRAGGNRNSTVELITRTPLSDKIMQRAADALESMYAGNDMGVFVQCDGTFDPDTKSADAAAILTFNTMMFIGSVKDMRGVMDGSGMESVQEFAKAAMSGQYQKELDEKLNRTGKVKEDDPDPGRYKKSDKKKKGRKGNAKVRRRMAAKSDAYVDFSDLKY